MKNYLITLLFVPFISLAQIGAKVQQQGSVHGIWQNSQFGYQMTLMLNADGSGEFDGEMIKYIVHDNKLALTQKGITTNYAYVLKGNELTLSGGDLEKAITFTRNGTNQTANTTTPNPTPQKKMGGVNGNVPLDETPSTDLIGVWSGNGETIEFKVDGNCIYLGNTFPYEVSQGHIILTTNQGKVMFAYTIKGNELVLSANGRQVLYQRGANHNGPSAQNNTGAGVAMELVGKWCYVNVTSTYSGGSSADECITLNADGTYVYYSERSMSVNNNAYSGGTNSQNGDRGTWYVESDRIYYNSQSQGRGSYRLEKRNHPKNVNDPMIVLDGKAFVTQTARQPWR